jgi:hypothetical protein
MSCPWLRAHGRLGGAAATRTNSPDAAAMAKRQLRLTAKLAAIVGELINPVEVAKLNTIWSASPDGDTGS